MRLLCTLSVIMQLALSICAQSKIKVKGEDNRFIVFKMGPKNDTILKNKTDLFYIKLPDSLKKSLLIYTENGRLLSTGNDTIYRMLPIKGMAYSHSFSDTLYEVLLEGTCIASSTITMEVRNTHSKKAILSNKFIIK